MRLRTLQFVMYSTQHSVVQYGHDFYSVSVIYSPSRIFTPEFQVYEGGVFSVEIRIFLTTPILNVIRIHSEMCTCTLLVLCTFVYVLSKADW